MLYSPEHIGKSLSQKRFGGICYFSICGAGETLAQPEIVEITENILNEGHLVNITTNGTLTNVFKKFGNINKENLSRLHFSFSFHYLELKRLKLTSKFFDNVRKMKENGISFTVEVTPSDEYIPYIEEIKEECMGEIGALPHITVCRIENGNNKI